MIPVQGFQTNSHLGWRAELEKHGNLCFPCCGGILRLINWRIHQIETCFWFGSETYGSTSRSPSPRHGCLASIWRSLRSSWRHVFLLSGFLFCYIPQGCPHIHELVLTGEPTSAHVLPEQTNEWATGRRVKTSCTTVRRWQEVWRCQLKESRTKTVAQLIFRQTFSSLNMSADFIKIINLIITFEGSGLFTSFWNLIINWLKFHEHVCCNILQGLDSNKGMLTGLSSGSNHRTGACLLVKYNFVFM